MTDRRDQGTEPEAVAWGHHQHQVRFCAKQISADEGKYLLPKLGDLSVPRKDESTHRVGCASPINAALPAVMDLVIKQFWPVLTTHLNVFQFGTAAFSGHQNSIEHSWRMTDAASFTFPGVDCPTGVIVQNKSPIYPLILYIYRGLGIKDSLYLKVNAYPNIKEENKSIYVKAVVQTNLFFRAWFYALTLQSGLDVFHLPAGNSQGILL